MVKKNNKKVIERVKETVKEIIAPKVDDTQEINVSKDTESVVEEKKDVIFNTVNINDLSLLECYNMKQCIDVLNKHYIHIREMNYGFDNVSYCAAKDKLTHLKQYEEKLLQVIENKVFEIKLE